MTLAGFAALLFWMAMLVIMGYITDWLLARIFSSNRAHRIFVGVGVIVHEASHWAACVLTRTEVFEVSLFEGTGGHVKHERRGPVVMAFIGLAPVIGCSLFLMLLSWLFGMGGVRFAPSGIDLNNPYSSITGMLLSAGSTLWMNLSPMNTVTALFLVYLYLVWSVVACIAPSGPDLKHAFVGAVILAGLCLLMIYLQPLAFLGWGGTPALDFIGGHLADTMGIGLILSFIPLIIAVPVALLKSRS
jgi:hypothetical protein